MTAGALTDLLRQGGIWTTAYVDGTGALPQVEEEARRRAVRDRLVDEGAPGEDAEAVEAALTANNGLPSPPSRVVMVTGGEVVLDESFIGPRLGPERFSHGTLPAVLPLLRHRSAATRYLVVETGRDGAEIRLETVGRGADTEIEIEGSTQDITKVQAGGGQQSAFHRYAESTWERNQADVADAVREIVGEEHPAFVIVSGDVRAAQLLRDALTDTERDLLTVVDANTRADGADSTELDAAISEALDAHTRTAIDEVRERAANDSGRSGAEGTSEVVAALQQARVDTLLLDNRMLDDDGTLYALDAEPWVAVDESESLSAGIIGRISAAEALARAALLTDARVLIEEDAYLADDEPRETRATRDPLAVLRWAEQDGEADGD